MKIKHLNVWLDDRHIATLDAKNPWDLRCRYERDVVASGIANRPLLSCSLPVVRETAVANSWVRGLLPEGNHLLALAARARVPTNYYADLLARFGRDVSGAFTISTGPPEPLKWAVEPYTDDQLVEELRLVLDAPGFAVRDDSELSIAGLQNKLLVTALPGGRWGRPCNGQPSSHIMKLADGRDNGLLAAEHACMQLAYAAKLTSVQTSLEQFDGIEVLIVQRYDRVIDQHNQSIKRIHQEDSCQALGVDIDSNQGRGKYERFGGPSFAGVAGILDRYGNSFTDHAQLLRTAVFTAVIGNADAHGKDVSLLVDTETGEVVLAPLYDTVPTALWPRLRATYAMSVNGKFGVPSRHDFISEATRWGMSALAAERVVGATIVDLETAIPTCRHEAVAELVTARLARLSADDR
jgi:serine/threonine-protein kinase HipA